MIEKAQKKLREARYFLSLLAAENTRAVRHEPEAFDFLISAFVSAARCVTFALQAEHKSEYDLWFQGWFADRSEEERQLLNLMKDHRNEEQKQGGGNRTIEWEYVPVTELSAEDLCGEVFYHGPPEAPPPRMARPVRYLSQGSAEIEALGACKRYFALLKELLENFGRQNVTPAPPAKGQSDDNQPTRLGL